MAVSFLGRFSRHLPSGRIARSIITLASGTAMSQAITVCAMPIVTRLYVPAQMGVISLFLAFFGFWSPALSLRYEYALLNARDDAESHIINRLAVICVTGMSILAMPALAVMHRFNVLGFGLLPWWSSFAAMPILFGYGQFMVCRAWGLRAGVVRDITISTITRSVANVVTRIGLGIIGCGVAGLFAAELAGAWGPAAALYRSVQNHFASSRPVIRLQSLKEVMRRYRKFPILETPSTFINNLSLALPIPMIAALHGPVAAGWFGLARAMVGIPNSQIGAAVGDVFQVELARVVVEGDYARGRQLFYKLLLRLSIFGLLPLLGIVGFAPWLMSFIFGHAWREAGWMAAIIAPWLYAALIVSSLSRLLSVLHAQEHKLFYDVMGALSFVGVFLLAKNMNWTITSLVVGLSTAGVFSYLIYLLVLVFVVETRLRPTETIC